jgi:hypothetical protein
MGWDSSVGIATRYGLDGPRIESQKGARFSAPVHIGSGPTQLPRCVYRTFPRVKEAGACICWTNIIKNQERVYCAVRTEYASLLLLLFFFFKVLNKPTDSIVRILVFLLSLLSLPSKSVEFSYNFLMFLPLPRKFSLFLSAPQVFVLFAIFHPHTFLLSSYSRFEPR